MNSLGYLFMLISLILSSWIDGDKLGSFTRIARINKTIENAESALKAKRYAKAIKEYTRLENEFNHNSDYLSMNFANAHFLNGEPERALEHYKKLTQSLDFKLSSEANRMVGKISESRKQYDLAEEAYKRALLKNPRNQTARKNLLDLKKNKPQPPDQQQNKDQQSKDQKQQEKQSQSDYGNKNTPPNSKQKNQSGDGEKDQQKANEDQNAKGKNQKGSQEQKAKRDSKGGEKTDTEGADETGEKGKSKEENNKGLKDKPLSYNDEEGDYKVSKDELKKMNISPEKAKAMLEAMRNAEVQYIQQKQLKAIFKSKGSKNSW